MFLPGLIGWCAIFISVNILATEINGNFVNDTANLARMLGNHLHMFDKSAQTSDRKGKRLFSLEQREEHIEVIYNLATHRPLCVSTQFI